MTTSNYITFILLGVIGLVFLIDFILNSRKKPLEKSVEKFVEKEKSEGKSSLKWLNWILDRKKNISLSLILIPILKAVTHFVIFPLKTVVVKQVIIPKHLLEDNSSEAAQRLRYQLLEDGPYMDIEETVNISIGGHFEVMFTDKLELFIPVTIVFLVVVWFFNDKIKAR